VLEHKNFNISETRKDTRTRKLSYRKDDRAMCPVYECPENFPEYLTIFFRLMS